VLARLAELTPGGGDLPDLDRAAEAIGEGLGAQACTITVRRTGLRDRDHAWARAGGPASPALVRLPIHHGGEEVGSIGLDQRTVDGLDADGRLLLTAVSGTLGVVLQAARAGIELERQLRTAVARAADIADARRRAVADADSERRRIERDLHDGVQHGLVTLSLALGLAEHEVAGGRRAAALDRLDEVVHGLDAAEAQLAATASGVSAPELGRAGLVAALRGEFTGSAVQLDFDGLAGEQRFPAAAEAAVYFCCLEAVGNARKHAPGARVVVRLLRQGDRLLFSVEDDGPGYAAPSAGAAGRGLRNMTSRLAAVGGRVEVRSAVGAGTTVAGWVTVAAAPEEPPEAPVPAGSLLDHVRGTVRRAHDVYHGTGSEAALADLSRWVDGPPTIAVLGPTPAAVEGVAAQLRREWGGGAHPRGWSRRPRPEDEVPVLVPLAAGADGAIDRLVGSLAAGATRPPEADAVVLLVPGRDADETYYSAATGWLGRLPACQVVAVLLGAAGNGGPVAAPAGLVRRCPLPPDPAPRQLAELVDTRVRVRWETFRARAVIGRVGELLRSAPPPGDGLPLRYELDRLASGWPELAELEVLEALADDRVGLAAADRAAAERLLGLHGLDLRTRLGCAAGSDRAQLSGAAAAQAVHWQQMAAHPASTAATRNLARMVVRTCEALVPGPRAG
jgi:signal transduction histidine kinase